MGDYYDHEQFEHLSLEDKLDILKRVYEQVKIEIEDFPEGDFDDEFFISCLESWAWEVSDLFNDLKDVAYEVDQDIHDLKEAAYEVEQDMQG